MGMELCSRSNMTQKRRSSMLLTFVVLMIVFVESSTGIMENVENKSENQTHYHDFKLNLIDSELNDNEIKNTTELNVIETISTDKGNVTTLNENVEKNLENENLIKIKLSIPEFEQSHEEPNKTHQTLDKFSPESATSPAMFPVETLTTLIPINEIKSFTENILSTEVTNSQIETQTQNFGMLQETTWNYKTDSSIYSEIETSQTRQVKGFINETENKVIVNDDPNFKYDISSNNSEQGIIFSYDSSYVNHSLNEEIKPRPESTTSIINDYLTKSLVDDLVEIVAVTQSIGVVQNDAKMVPNVETHTIIKKPSVDDKPIKNVSILEQLLDIDLIKADTKLNTAVNMILNTQNEVFEPSTTLLSITEYLSPNIATSTQSTGDGLDDATLEVNLEDDNSVVINTETLNDNWRFKLEANSAIPLQKIFNSQNKNTSSLPNMVSYNRSNLVPNSKTDDDTPLKVDILVKNIDISTYATTTNITSILKSIHQASEEKNEIYQERKRNLNVHTNIETSTEKLIEDQMKAPLQNKQIIMVTNSDYIQPNTNLPIILNDKVTSAPNEEPISEINYIHHSENNIKEHIDSKTLEEVQEDKTNNILLKTDDNHLYSTNDSLLAIKVYEQEETITKVPDVYKMQDATTVLSDNYEILTTARHVDSIQTMRDESSSVMSEKMAYPDSVSSSFNEIVAEGLGKPLPTRSVDDEPFSSLYSSEDKTTTVLMLCASAGGIFIAFSFAVYLISFQRQHGTLDIEMQEQRCGKDNLDDEEDLETRVSLLNQIPTADSDEHSSD